MTESVITDDTPDYIKRMNLIEDAIDIPHGPIDYRFSGRLKRKPAPAGSPATQEPS